ncbi:MAG: serine hydrolase [Clostridia bacterium]|nr:serine hydrolase [Clostridia bacterium]
MMIYPQADFARSTPEAQGISSAAIENVLRDIRDSGADIHSMLIMRRGRLVFEHYFAPYTAETPHSMYSCSKTFTSMLIGIAQDKGLLSVKDRVLSFFPEQEIKEPSENLSAMTIEDLLMMGTGNAQDTFPYMMRATQPDADWVNIFLNRPVEHKPGTHFVYNTGATYMLSAILTKVTGRTALDLANEWLFGPMGIDGAAWDACPRGVSLGGTGLHITPRDMLRMGMLLLGRGRWKNQQLVSPEYIAEAQKKHIENRSGDPAQDPNWAAGYCYQMWRCCFDAYRADGMGGQFIVVMPRQEMIVVFTSALGGDKPIGYPLWLIERKLLPGVFDLPQVYGVDAAESLAKLAAQLSAPQARPMPEGAKAFPFGRRIGFGPEGAALFDSGAGLKLMSLTVDEAKARIEMNAGVVEAEYAWGAPKINAAPQIALGGWAREAVISGQADWDGEKGLRLAVRYLGEPLTIRFDVKTDGGAAHVRVMATLGGVCRVEGRVE